MMVNPAILQKPQVSPTSQQQELEIEKSLSINEFNPN